MVSRISGVTVALLGLALASCSGSDGAAGKDGANGTGCTAVNNGDGTYTVTCGTDVVTVTDGTNGTDGQSCTVTDDGAGTKTITCQDGTVATVTDGADVDPATVDNLQAQIDAINGAKPESCPICHENTPAEEHQDIYDMYTDDSTLGLSIDSVTTNPNGDGTFATVLTFSATDSLWPYLDVAGLPTLDQKTFYAVQYDDTTGTFDNGTSFTSYKDTNNKTVQVKAQPTATPGEYTLTIPNFTYDIKDAAFNGQIFGYIAKGKLETESGGHVTMYDNVASAAMHFGNVTNYVSPANVSACESCHGKPYMKHGYRNPIVAGLNDFESCKSCHNDSAAGGDLSWQISVDDPARWAEVDNLAITAKAAGDTGHDTFNENLTDTEKAKYYYTKRLMNDVHMAHSMEFPYPQSMANCATCHKDKLDKILTKENFNLATCRSCHPLNGSTTYGTYDNSLEAIWKRAVPAAGSPTVSVWDEHKDLIADVSDPTVTGGTGNPNPDCTSCHYVSAFAPTFAQIHNGYNPKIYASTDGTSAGTFKYSDWFTVSIDTASFNPDTNILNVHFFATKDAAASAVALDVTDIVPTLLIGLYGYDTKDFIVAAHGKAADGSSNLEFPIDGTTTNPRFTVVSASGGVWEVKADLSLWADKIADGTIRRAEIAVTPWLGVIVGQKDSHTNGETDDKVYALNAPSRTFDLTADDFADDFYPDIVDVNKCNSCHDALATTFHAPDRGGNVKVCRICHESSNGGYHLEMQSRAIDSWVHAIHSFQAFDTNTIDFTDPVQKKRYEQHIEHTFPNFTAKNCEACHNPGMYEVPDATKSLPAVLSGSATWNVDRNIGTVGSYVVGPATRACGGCHRAHFINEDDAGKLAAFYEHTKVNGYQIPNGTGVWDAVVKKIEGMFQ